MAKDKAKSNKRLFLCSFQLIGNVDIVPTSILHHCDYLLFQKICKGPSGLFIIISDYILILIR